ncbi:MULTISPECIES: HNH endonuclease signature motif containing protein [Brevibacterium]|nr:MULTISPECIES: HNH endonuclease signature motif containing protein [Brevibacterium]
MSGSAVGSSSASGAEPAVQHPLLSDEAWQDLSRIAPELTSSIESLDHLKNDLRTFDRPMGPDEAVLVVDGIETATRILESLSALALAVFERCGTPTDFGAKSTRDLVQNRLQLTGTEAARRTELAKNLGNRVGLSGQSVEPLCPAVAEGLHSGVLSAGQAAVIGECLEKLPSRFGPEVRAETERILVEHAPQVRVADLRVIFKRILDEIDPDGQEPKDPQDRSMYRVNLRSRKDGDWDLTGLLDPITGGVLHGLLTSRIQSAAERDAAASGPAAGASARADGTAAGDSAAAAMVGAGDSAGTEGARVIGATAGAADANNAPADSADRSAQEMFEIFDAVLSGDRYDAPLLPVGTAFGTESGPRGTDSRTRGTESGPRSDSSGANGSDYSAADEVPAGFGVREDGTIVDVRSEQGSVKNRIYERFSTLMSRIDMTRVAAGAPYALVVTAKADELAERKGAGVSGAETPVPITELAAGGLNGAVFFHLMSEEAKTVQVTTEKRYANAKQLAILASRDQGCTFPGCETPPGWCDAHHIVPWAEQGRTSLSNLTLTCGRHHHLIDKSDWHTVMLKDGRPAWVPPASIDPARKPILHARFIAREIIETLFD